MLRGKDEKAMEVLRLGEGGFFARVGKKDKVREFGGKCVWRV